MSYQNISFELTEADFDAVQDAIDTIEAKLPFLVTLSGDERKELMKLGPKSADFVGDAQDAASSFPSILPVAFNAAEFAKDAAMFEKLSKIKMDIDALQEKISHTYTAVGSEAMNASLVVYAYVQTASQNTPGIQSVAQKLQERFKRPGKGKNG